MYIHTCIYTYKYINTLDILSAFGNLYFAEWGPKDHALLEHPSFQRLNSKTWTLKTVHFATWSCCRLQKCTVFFKCVNIWRTFIYMNSCIYVSRTGSSLSTNKLAEWGTSNDPLNNKNKYTCSYMCVHRAHACDVFCTCHIHTIDTQRILQSGLLSGAAIACWVGQQHWPLKRYIYLHICIIMYTCM